MCYNSYQQFISLQVIQNMIDLKNIINNNKYMSRTQEQLDIEKEKNLINEELDYFYQKEQELLGNLSTVMELRQDLLNGLKDDLKKLSNIYKQDNEIEVDVESIGMCKNCSTPCFNLYCDECDKEISDWEFSRQSE